MFPLLCFILFRLDMFEENELVTYISSERIDRDGKGPRGSTSSQAGGDGEWAWPASWELILAQLDIFLSHCSLLYAVIAGNK